MLGCKIQINNLVNYFEWGEICIGLGGKRILRCNLNGNNIIIIIKISKPLSRFSATRENNLFHFIFLN